MTDSPAIYMHKAIFEFNWVIYNILRLFYLRFVFDKTRNVNMKTIFTVMNTSWAVAKKGPKKNLGLYGIWTNDLCDIDAVLYQLS